jgi:hypothetical protein
MQQLSHAQPWNEPQHRLRRNRCRAVRKREALRMKMRQKRSMNIELASDEALPRG